MPTVTSKGQVTLRKKVRDALGIQPGTEVEFDADRPIAHLPERLLTGCYQRCIRGRLPCAECIYLAIMARIL